ncbi:hypothetical protein ASD12_23675 [Mesorhizobium sp. Root102]|nr:hypothetical protein ASD12_23675 [Mesorhizobium sp. Root102]
MITKLQIFLAATLVISVVLVAIVFLIAPANDLPPTPDSAKTSDVISRPSDVTPGNGQDFKPKW